MVQMSAEEKLKILMSENGSTGLDCLADVLYKGFQDKINNGFQLKPHDIQFIEEMWFVREHDKK